MPIPIITNFNVNSTQPIDSRMVAINIAARNNITHKYDGLKVFVQSDRKTYVYNSNTLSWAVDGGGSGPSVDLQVGQGPLVVFNPIITGDPSTIFSALPSYWTKIDKVVSVSGSINVSKLSNTSYAFRVDIPNSFPISDPNSVAGTGVLRCQIINPNNPNYTINNIICSISADYVTSNTLFANFRFTATGVGSPAPLDQYILSYNYTYLTN